MTTALPLGSWQVGPLVPAGWRAMLKSAGTGQTGRQRQGQRRVAASQTTAEEEEEDGDAELAAEEDGEEGLFQNSQRRLGCRFRCR